MMRLNYKSAALLFAASLLCSAGPAKHKLSAELQAASPSPDLVRVIIQWNRETQNSTDQKIVALGGTLVNESKNIHMGTYLVPASSLALLEKDPDVKHISAEKQVHQKLANAAAAVGAPSTWLAGYSGAGIGVAVLDSGINNDDNLNDNGAVYSEDFTYSTRNADGSPAPKPQGYGQDWYGHGQHIAGIIASNGKQSRCDRCTSAFIGIAPGSNLIDLKVLDRTGQGSTSSVIAAIDRAITLKNVYNIRVINLSLGQPVAESYEDDPLCQAAEEAWRAGIVVVVAAGNDGRDNSFGNQGYGTITSPGNDPYVITVGAMKTMGTPQTADDLIASYSSKGPSAVDQIVKPDVVAPGNQIVSLRARSSLLPLEYPNNIVPLSLYSPNSPSTEIAAQPQLPADANAHYPDARIGRGYSNTYFTLSGTSMAAAVVSGAVADLLQANPNLTPDQVKMLLMMTAGKTFPSSSTVTDSSTGNIYVSYYDIFTIGAGYINLPAALARIKNVPTGLTAKSPVATYDQASGSVQLKFDPSSVFSDRATWGTGTTFADRATWGTSGIWGTSVLSGNMAVDSSRATWGTSGTSAQSGVWGTSALWGNASVWGASTSFNAESITAFGEQ